MMEVQKYLKDNSLEKLKEELGIKIIKHPTEPLMILNYDQINSPKTHPVVRECRALVLNSETHDIVARSFPRFFNWGEAQEEMKLFNFNKFVAQTKEDGSLVLIYRHNGTWRAHTRGSFALEESTNGISWQK